MISPRVPTPCLAAKMEKNILAFYVTRAKHNKSLNTVQLKF